MSPENKERVRSVLSAVLPALAVLLLWIFVRRPETTAAVVDVRSDVAEVCDTMKTDTVVEDKTATKRGKKRSSKPDKVQRRPPSRDFLGDPVRDRLE